VVTFFAKLSDIQLCAKGYH